MNDHANDRINSNSSRYLANATPLEKLHTAQLINRGEVVATMKDATKEAVMARAERLRSMQRWSGAEVIYHAP